MARKTVRVSDMSGDEIRDGRGALVKVVFEDARRGVFELDMTADEAENLSKKGRSVKRRGRPRKLAVA